MAFTTEQAAATWKTQNREHITYWVPEADIEGEIPTDLVGTFFRNGPGNDSVWNTKLKHPIDGDGLIVALTFPGNGRVHFQSRFVQSRHRVEEQQARRMLYRGQMGTNPYSFKESLKAVVKARLGWEKHSAALTYRNTSNTNVYLWEGKLLSAYEVGLPHCLDPTSLETLGEDDLNGTLSLKVLGAHFRYDPYLDHLVTLSAKAGVDRPPSLAIHEYGREWKVKSAQLFRIPGLNYAHDLLLSKHFYIVQISPFVDVSKADIYRFLLGLSSPGDAMRYFDHLPCRLVIIPRTPEVGKTLLNGQPWIFADIPEPCHIFHFGNVLERIENGRLTGLDLQAVCLGKKFTMEFENKLTLSNASKAPGLWTSFEVRFNGLKIDANTKPHVTQRILHEASVEFPTIHPYRHGLPTRYSYMMASSDPKRHHYYTAVLKHDLKEEKTMFWQSEGLTGEPCFIPRGGYPKALEKPIDGLTSQAVVSDPREEDDGYVVVQVFDPKKQRTNFAILDAKTMKAIAVIKLNHMVCSGFHGTFSPEVFLPNANAPFPAAPVFQSKLSWYILPQPQDSLAEPGLDGVPEPPLPLSPASLAPPDAKFKYEFVTFPKRPSQEAPLEENARSPDGASEEHHEEEEDIELEPLPDHLITTYSPRYPLSSSSSSTTKHQPQSHSPDAKYLTFLPHSGFHNQRSELENALVLARLLNRTLIMPKVYLGPPMPWLSFPLLHDRLLYQTKIGLKRCRALIEHRDVEPMPGSTNDGGQELEQEDDDSEEFDFDENGVESGDAAEIVDFQHNSQNPLMMDMKMGSKDGSISTEEQAPQGMEEIVVEQGERPLQDHLGRILGETQDAHESIQEDSNPQSEIAKLNEEPVWHHHHHHHLNEQRQDMGPEEANPASNLVKRSSPAGQRPFAYRSKSTSKTTRKKKKTLPKKWVPLPAECLQYESWTMTDWDLFFNLDPLRRYVRLESRESISMTYLQEEFGLSIPLEEQKRRPPKSSTGSASASQDGTGSSSSSGDEGGNSHEDSENQDDLHGTSSEEAAETETRPLLRPLGDVLFFEDTSLYDYRFTEDPQAPESLKTQSKFLQEFTVDWLAQRQERLIHLGSIFGTGRVSISKPESKAWLRMVREHLILQTEILQKTSQTIADRMAGGSALRKKIVRREMKKAGRASPPPPFEASPSPSTVDLAEEDSLEDESGFVGIHIRMSDGHFSLSARKTIENIRKELLWQMGVQDPLHLEGSEAGADHDSPQEYQGLHPNQEGQQMVFQQPSPNPPPSYSEKRFSVKECRRMSLKHWSASVASSAADAASYPQDQPRVEPASLGWQRSQGLQTPIFLATDAHNPRANPIFANLFATFDCLFTLDDFREELEELEQFRNPEDGVRLAPFLIPMIDAMVVAKAGAFFGTPMSTFSNYIARQLRPAYTGIHV
ncbi:hypothetical protein BGZ73_006298 [Actinomortierella ambigua]|nr:hypothetical protein BGZ73_006298 [Actinomortierella ambigua]